MVYFIYKNIYIYIISTKTLTNISNSFLRESSLSLSLLLQLQFEEFISKISTLQPFYRDIFVAAGRCVCVYMSPGSTLIVF